MIDDHGQPLNQNQRLVAYNNKKAIGIGCMVLLLFLGIFAAIATTRTESGNSSVSSTPKTLIVTQEEYGSRWPYTIPKGQLLCRQRYAGTYLNKDVTITYDGKTYSINGSARGQREYLPLEMIWRDDPEHSGAKIPDPGIIQKGLTLCK